MPYHLDVFNKVYVSPVYLQKLSALRAFLKTFFYLFWSPLSQFLIQNFHSQLIHLHVTNVQIRSPKPSDEVEQIHWAG